LPCAGIASPAWNLHPHSLNRSSPCRTRGKSASPWRKVSVPGEYM
jgi:hypothetical protein